MARPVELEGAFTARPTDSNKYSVGTVAVVGGSRRFPHAPVISALGGAAGVALTFAAALALKFAADVTLTVSAEVVLAGLLLSCGTGVVFGVYPALKAARLRPAETLRR